MSDQTNRMLCPITGLPVNVETIDLSYYTALKSELAALRAENERLRKACERVVHELDSPDYGAAVCLSTIEQLRAAIKGAQ